MSLKFNIDNLLSAAKNVEESQPAPNFQVDSEVEVTFNAAESLLSLSKAEPCSESSDEPFPGPSTAQFECKLDKPEIGSQAKGLTLIKAEMKKLRDENVSLRAELKRVRRTCTEQLEIRRELRKTRAQLTWAHTRAYRTNEEALQKFDLKEQELNATQVQLALAQQQLAQKSHQLVQTETQMALQRQQHAAMWSSFNHLCQLCQTYRSVTASCQRCQQGLRFTALMALTPAQMFGPALGQPEQLPAPTAPLATAAPLAPGTSTATAFPTSQDLPTLLPLQPPQ